MDAILFPNRKSDRETKCLGMDSCFDPIADTEDCAQHLWLNEIELSGFPAYKT